MREYILTRAELLSESQILEGKTGRYIDLGLRDEFDGHITECVIYQYTSQKMYALAQKSQGEVAQALQNAIYNRAVTLLRKGDKFNVVGRPNYIDRPIESKFGKQHVEQEIVVVEKFDLDKDIPRSEEKPFN